MKRTQIVVSGHQWNIIWLDALQRVRREFLARSTGDGLEPRFEAMYLLDLLRDVRKKLEEADA